MEEKEDATFEECEKKCDFDCEVFDEAITLNAEKGGSELQELRVKDEIKSKTHPPKTLSPQITFIHDSETVEESAQNSNYFPVNNFESSATIPDSLEGTNALNHLQLSFKDGKEALEPTLTQINVQFSQASEELIRASKFHMDQSQILLRNIQESTGNLHALVNNLSGVKSQLKKLQLIAEKTQKLREIVEDLERNS